VIGGVLVAGLLCEIILRAKVQMENEGVLSAQLDTGLKIPSDRNVTLIHLIRFSAQPSIIYELRPNLSVFFLGQACTTNSIGFRSPEPADGDGGRRIVGIGDSVMFGWGVSDEQTYLAVLEEELDHRLGPLGGTVINTAVPGYNAVMEVETLEHRGLRFRPDVVIMNFVGNDLYLPNFIRSKKKVFDLGRSHFVDFLRRSTGVGWHKSDWTQLRLAGVESVPPEESTGFGRSLNPDDVPPQYRDMVGWPAYSRTMTRLAEMSREHGFEVIWLSTAPGMGASKKRAMAIARDLGFTVVDAGPSLDEYMNLHDIQSFIGSALTISATDPHPSALSHKIIAAVLLEHFGPGGTDVS